MANLGIFNILVQAKTKKASSGFRKLQADIGAFKKAALAGLGAVGVAFSTSFVKSTMDAIDAQKKFSSRLNVSFESLQALQHEAQLSGVSMQNLSIGVQRLSRRIGQSLANGSGQAKDALEKLGLTLDDVRGLDAVEQFRLIGKRIDKVKDSAEKLAVTFAFLDTEGVGAVNMFGDMAASSDEAIQKLTEMGVIISSIDAKKIEMANDAMTIFKKQIDVAAAMLIGKMAPFLTAVLKKMIEYRKALPVQQAINNGLAKMGKVLAGIATAVSIVAKVFKVAFRAIHTAVAFVLSGLSKLFEKTVEFFELDESTKSFAKSLRENLDASLEDSTNKLRDDLINLGKAVQFDEIGKSFNENFEALKDISVEATKIAEATLKMNAQKKGIIDTAAEREKARAEKSRLKQIQDAAGRIRENIKTPMEKLQDKLTEAAKLVGVKGGITLEELAKFKDQLVKEIPKVEDAIKKTAPQMAKVFDPKRVNIAALATQERKDPQQEQANKIAEEQAGLLQQIVKNTEFNLMVASL